MAQESRRPHTETGRWENEGGRVRASSAPVSDDLQVELQRFGITPVQLMAFDWGGYRYSNVRDAIAAAKRLVKST